MGINDFLTSNYYNPVDYNKNKNIRLHAKAIAKVWRRRVYAQEERKNFILGVSLIAVWKSHF